MAENEYLDSTKSRRWMPVADGLHEGCTQDELAERFKTPFLKTLRILFQEIPFANLLASVDDPAKLNHLCQGIDGASDVKSMLQEAAENSSNLVAAYEHFLRLAAARCAYDIPYLASERGSGVNLSEARRRVDAVRTQLSPEFRRIAEKWAKDSSWKPVAQRKKATVVQPAGDAIRKMLGESLIAGFKK